MEKEELNKLKSDLEEKSNSIDLKKEEFLDLENQATERFKEDIKGYVNHKNYSNIKEYLKLITNPNTKIKCLVLKSDQGLGKTTLIKNALKEMNKEFLYINSYSTALAFYKLVYHNKYKHIILDDVYGLYSDEKGISILRALTNTEKIRYIKYESTSDKLDVPSNFIFEGSITILTNKITNEMDNSLLGRAIFREINFTLKEKLEFVKDVIKFQYDLKKDEIKKIVDFLYKNVDETTRNFSFRSVLKITEFYKHSKTKWKELSIEELEKDEELILIQSIMNSYTPIRNQKWVDETGKTIRTLQRKIKEFKKRQNDITTEMLDTDERGYKKNGN